MQPVVIVEYDPKWPEIFEAEKQRITALDENLAVEHIGSTAVVGACAKPIIDILVGVEDLEKTAELIEKLEKLGYEYIPEFEREIPNRRYLQKEGFHIHVAKKGGEFWNAHLQFRDFLRRHPFSVQAYCELKKYLAQKYKHDRNAYTNAKSEFIRGILEGLKEEN
jgi:GrpB-like predicted nucleotidyltransferase (UPF0157 family)